MSEVCCRRCITRCSRRCGCARNNSLEAKIHITEVDGDFRYVLLPNNVFLKFWDLIMLFLLVTLMFSIPFSIGVSAGALLLDKGENLWFILNMIVYAFFVIDTILYFFRAYYDRDLRLVCSHSKIAYNYLTGWFFVDLIACFPTPIIQYIILQRAAENPDTNGMMDNETQKAFNLVRYLDLFQLLRLTRASRAANNSWGFNEMRLSFSFIVYETIKFVSVLCWIIHVMACIWSFLYVLYIYEENSYTWLNKWYDSQANPALEPFGTNSENIWQRYVLCLYWSAYTLVSLGYGDITPQTVPEFWVCAFIISIDAVLWAFVIANAVNIISIYQHENMNFRLSIDAANKILKRIDKNGYQDDPTLKHEVRNYFLELHNKTHAFGSLQEAQDVVETHLSPLLWKRVLIGLSRPLFDAVPVLQGLSPESQFRIASAMMTSNLAPGEVLIVNSSKKQKKSRKNEMKQSLSQASSELTQRIDDTPTFTNGDTNYQLPKQKQTDDGLVKQQHLEGEVQDENENNINENGDDDGDNDDGDERYQTEDEKKRFPNNAIYILQTGMLSGCATYKSYVQFNSDAFDGYFSKVREGTQCKSNHRYGLDNQWFIQSAPGKPLGVTEMFLDESSGAIRQYRLQALNFCEFLIVPKEVIVKELKRDKEFRKRSRRKKFARLLHWWAKSVHMHIHALEHQQQKHQLTNASINKQPTKQIS